MIDEQKKEVLKALLGNTYDLLQEKKEITKSMNEVLKEKLLNDQEYQTLLNEKKEIEVTIKNKKESILSDLINEKDKITESLKLIKEDLSSSLDIKKNQVSKLINFYKTKFDTDIDELDILSTIWVTLFES